jgi:hypothetical protein
MGHDGVFTNTRDGERGGVEHGAGGTLTVAIDGIANQCRAKAGQRVDADLVSAAGFGAEFNQRHAGFARDDFPMGDGGLALFGRDHAPAVFNRADLEQGKINGALLALHFGGDHTEIDFAYLARFEGGGKAFEGLGIARQQQTAI